MPKAKKMFQKMLLGGFLLVGILAVGVFFALSWYAKNLVNQEEARQASWSNDEKAKELGLTLLTSEQASQLADQTFQTLNQIRQQHGALALVKNTQQCDYLQNKLQAITVWGDLNQPAAITEEDVKQTMSGLLVNKRVGIFIQLGISQASQAQSIVQNWWNTDSTSRRELLQTSRGHQACIVATPMAIALIVSE